MPAAANNINESLRIINYLLEWDEPADEEPRVAPEELPLRLGVALLRLVVPLFLLTVEVEPEADCVVILVLVEPELRTLLLVVLETLPVLLEGVLPEDALRLLVVALRLEVALRLLEVALRLLDELLVRAEGEAVVYGEVEAETDDDDDADLRAFALAAEVVVVVPALARDWMSRALVTRLPLAAAGISAVRLVNDLSGCCWP